ncbi:MAG: peptidoglycan-binding protein [Bifidobacteriaceae bacterium]|nr:peptidoglycan-binding protein [Bifidobacteriaceae bacterium]MCI1978721.1 peptidoglycan-binding protein [Bifidobacteriaceae bacterium]
MGEGKPRRKAKRAFSEHDKGTERTKSARGWATALLTGLGIALLVVTTVIATIGITAAVKESRTPRPQEVTTAVRKGRVVHGINATVTAIPAMTQTVSADGVVTRAGKSTNTEIGEGGVISTINERPLFLFKGAIPMYRALSRGAKGKDVTQLQDALKRLGFTTTDQKGVYGISTARAVGNFYESKGYTAVDSGGSALSGAALSGAGVPASELVFMTSVPAKTSANCGIVGRRISGELCTLTTKKSEYLVKVVASLLQETDSLDGVAVEIGSGSAQASLGKEVILDTASVSPESATSATSQAGSDGGSDSPEYRYFSFTVPDSEKAPKLADGQSARIVLDSSDEGSLILPSIALRADGERYWVQGVGGKHYAVTVGLCYEGDCVVEGQGLSVGTSVVLPQSDTAVSASGESGDGDE